MTPTEPIPTLNPTEPVADKWMVLHTKSRQEKAVARHLEAAGCDFDLPLLHRTTTTKGRKHESDIPLFSGYVFLKGQLQDAYDAMATKRICNIIEVKDQQSLESQLQKIHEAIDTGLPVEEYPQMAKGTRCRVTSGPLQGTEGVVIEHGRKTRLVLQVEILGIGAAVEINQDELETVD